MPPLDAITIARSYVLETYAPILDGLTLLLPVTIDEVRGGGVVVTVLIAGPIVARLFVSADGRVERVAKSSSG